jgi:hypothetical protein
VRGAVSNVRPYRDPFSFDLPRNLIWDGTHGYVYDAENRITCVVGTDQTCTSSTATNHYYNPGGQRVAKWRGQWGLGGTAQEEYVYDISGNQESAHNGTGSALRNELYDPNGRHMATYASSTLTYNLADWLGTERLRTNSSGTETCMDTPYGMNLRCSGLSYDPSPMHFTGKQLDTETGNDYFGARYLEGNLGRWTSTDST